MAETAASTFFSNSSSVMVSVVRSIFSMNWTAPIYATDQTKYTMNQPARSYQRRQIIASFAPKLVLVAEAQDILHIRY